MKNALTGVERALFWTLAFAAFAAAAAGLSARAVDHMAGGYEQERRGYAIVRVLEPGGPEGVAAAETLLAQSPYVSSAAPMTAGRAAAVLGRGSGAPIDPATMPQIRLIEVELMPTLLEDDTPERIVSGLSAGGVNAEIIHERAQDNTGIAAQARTFAAWGAGAFAAVMAVIVWLSARSVAARRRELVTVMTDLGATSGQAAGSLADEVALIGLYAGLVGSLLAAVIGFIILLAAAPDTSVNALPSLLNGWDFAPLIAPPLGAAVAAGLGARAAASVFHRQAARLG